MGPEIVSAILGRPGAVANISASVADVLGTSTFLIFLTMLAVTPIHTITGWRWHVILRRDYGIAMFATAATDITLAAITTGDTFPGTVLTRIGGHTFLFAGTFKRSRQRIDRMRGSSTSVPIHTPIQNAVDASSSKF